MNKQNSIRISVIIPCFNDGEFIQEAIASVEICPDPIYEVIIVNDGSTDQATLDVLNDLRNIGYKVIDQQNRGPAAARNTGIRAAQGEYILPVDSDCRIRPGYLYQGIEILDRCPDVAVVYSDLELFGEQTGVKKVLDFNLSWLVVQNYIDNCAVFRKSVWIDCGPYDEEMPFYGLEDWDFWLNIAKKNTKFHHIPEALFEYRVRVDSVSTSYRQEEKTKLMSRYMASKHAAWFPKEYRYFLKPYRALVKIKEAYSPFFEWKILASVSNFFRKVFRRKGTSS